MTDHDKTLIAAARAIDPWEWWLIGDLESEAETPEARAAIHRMMMDGYRAEQRYFDLQNA